MNTHHPLLALFLRIRYLAQIPLRLALLSSAAGAAGAGQRGLDTTGARCTLGIDELLLLLIELLVVISRAEAVRIPHLFGVVGADLVNAHELHEGGE